MNLQEKRKNWYSDEIVLKSIVNYAKYRELCFMKRENTTHCIRFLSVSSPEFLMRLFSQYHFFENDYNIYVSCAKFNKIPFFDLDLRKRKESYTEWKNNEALKSILTYDFMLDMDLNLENTKELNILSNFLTILNNWKITFYYYMSGNGFQIVIPSSSWGFDKNNIDEEMKRQKLIQLKIKSLFSIYFLCEVGLLNPFRLMKCLYSLVVDKPILDNHYIIDDLFIKNKLEVINFFIIPNIYIFNYGNKDNPEYFNKFITRL